MRIFLVSSLIQIKGRKLDCSRLVQQMYYMSCVCHKVQTERVKSQYAGNTFPPNCPLCSMCEKFSHREWKERQSACWHRCLMQLMCFCKSQSSAVQSVKSPSGRQWAQSAGCLSTFFPQQNVMSHTDTSPRSPSPHSPSCATPDWMLWHIQLH